MKRLLPVVLLAACKGTQAVDSPEAASAASAGVQAVSEASKSGDGIGLIQWIFYGCSALGALGAIIFFALAIYFRSARSFSASASCMAVCLGCIVLAYLFPYLVWAAIITVAIVAIVAVACLVVFVLDIRDGDIDNKFIKYLGRWWGDE